ncbi:MAG: FG-GAP repeat protein [Myxococcales bacterium]|nr:FG-GAP repeat protein [Myxococcales bacterium]
MVTWWSVALLGCPVFPDPILPSDTEPSSTPTGETSSVSTGDTASPVELRLQGVLSAASHDHRTPATRPEGAQLAPAGPVFGDGMAVGVGTGRGAYAVGSRAWLVGFDGGEGQQLELLFPTAGTHTRVTAAPDLTGDGVPDLFAATLCYRNDPTCSLDATRSAAWIVPGPLTVGGDISAMSGVRPVTGPTDGCAGIDAIPVGDRLAISGCDDTDDGIVWMVQAGDGKSPIDLTTGPQLTGDIDDWGMGWSLASGDVTGDGVDDLVTGSFSSDHPYIGMSCTVVDGLDLDASGKAPALGRRFDSGSRPEGMVSGGQVGVGDVDGDGDPEAIFATTGTSTAPGRIWRIPHLDALSWEGEDVERIDADAPPTDAPASPSLAFGHGFDMAGDLDGDGTDDLIVGDPWASDPRRGVTWLLPGSALSGVVSLGDIEPLAVIVSDVDNGLFGTDALGPGDLDADGWPDVVVGADNTELGGGHLGTSVYLGGPL